MKHQKYEELLSGYIDGELNAAERETVRQHLTECEGCRRLLSELEQVNSRIASLGPVSPAALHISNEARRELATAIGRSRVVLPLLGKAWGYVGMGLAIALVGAFLLLFNLMLKASDQERATELVATATPAQAEVRSTPTVPASGPITFKGWVGHVGPDTVGLPAEGGKLWLARSSSILEIKGIDGQPAAYKDLKQDMQVEVTAEVGKADGPDILSDMRIRILATPEETAAQAEASWQAYANAVKVYLSGVNLQRTPRETVAKALQRLAREKGGELRGLTAAEGDVPVFLARFEAPRFRYWAHIFWVSGSEVRVQATPITQTGVRMGDLANLLFAAQQARTIKRDGKTEMVVVATNTTPTVYFFLARLENDSWRQVWSLPEGSIEGPPAIRRDGGRIELPAEGIDSFALLGPVPANVEVSQVFYEFESYAKQTYRSTWARRGDAYMQTGGRTIPTPMTTLANLLDRLQRGDRAGAGALVTSAAMVDKMLELGWNEKPVRRDGKWLASSAGPEGSQSSLRFWDAGKLERSFAVAFEQRADNWLVKSFAHAATPSYQPPRQ